MWHQSGAPITRCLLSPPSGGRGDLVQTGEIKWRGEFVWIGEPLADEWICLKETETGDWQVRFYNAPVGIIDRATNRLQSMKPKDKASRRKYQ